MSFKVNAFLSLLSPLDDLKTALHSSHGKMDEVAPVIEPERFGHSFSWLQVIHDTNYVNEVNRKSRRVDVQCLNDFALGKEWRQALELDCVPVEPTVADVTRFTYTSPNDRSTTEIVMHGLKGDRVFDKVRRSRLLYDIDLLEFVSFFLPRDPVVLEVGARFGYDTVYFGKVLGATVIACESDPESLRLLRSNITDNALTNVRVLEQESPSPHEKVSLIKIDSNKAYVPSTIATIERDRPFVMARGSDEQLRPLDEVLHRLGYVRSSFFSGTSTVFYGPSRSSFWRGIARRRLARTFRKFKR